MSKLIIPSASFDIRDKEVYDFLSSLIEDGSFWGYIMSLIEQDNDFHSGDMNEIKYLIEAMSQKLDNIKISSTELITTRASKTDENDLKEEEENPLAKYINATKNQVSAEEVTVTGTEGTGIEEDDFDDLLGGFSLED